MPELPEVEALRRALDDPVSAFPVAKAGPAHIATLKTYRPAAARARGTAVLRRGAAREAAALPDRGRRARPAAAHDERGPDQVPQGGREGAQDARLPARVPGRRPAGDDRGRPEEARRSLASLAGGGRGRVGAHRARGARPRRRSGSARSSPTESRRLHSLLRDQRLLAGIGRAWANEILHVAELSPFALSTQLSAEEVERLAAAIDSELGARPRAARARRRRQDRLPRPQASRRAVPALRPAARTGRLRRAHGLLLPHLPDRRPGAEGPATFAPAALGAGLDDRVLVREDHGLHAVSQ